MSSADVERIEAALGLLSLEEKQAVLARLAQQVRSDRGRAHAEQKARLLSLVERLDRLPVANPSDGWSREDHDAVLYGSPS